MNAGAAVTTGGKHVLLYDGVCRLCAGVVKFVVARDPTASIHFCALQSVVAQPILAAHGIAPEDALQSFLLLRPDGTLLRRSDAALALGGLLSQPWPLLAVAGYIFPRAFRDAVYGCVARHRYSMFGKTASPLGGRGEADGGDDDTGDEGCLLPTRALMARMLDAEELRASLRYGSGKASSTGAAKKMK